MGCLNRFPPVVACDFRPGQVEGLPGGAEDGRRHHQPEGSNGSHGVFLFPIQVQNGTSTRCWRLAAGLAVSSRSTATKVPPRKNDATSRADALHTGLLRVLRAVPEARDRSHAVNPQAAIRAMSSWGATVRSRFFMFSTHRTIRHCSVTGPVAVWHRWRGVDLQLSRVKYARNAKTAAVTPT